MYILVEEQEGQKKKKAELLDKSRQSEELKNLLIKSEVYKISYRADFLMSTL